PHERSDLLRPEPGPAARGEGDVRPERRLRAAVLVVSSVVVSTAVAVSETTSTTALTRLAGCDGLRRGARGRLRSARSTRGGGHPTVGGSASRATHGGRRDQGPLRRARPTTRARGGRGGAPGPLFRPPGLAAGH